MSDTKRLLYVLTNCRLCIAVCFLCQTQNLPHMRNAGQSSSSLRHHLHFSLGAYQKSCASKGPTVLLLSPVDQHEIVDCISWKLMIIGSSEKGFQ